MQLRHRRLRLQTVRTVKSFPLGRNIVYYKILLSFQLLIRIMKNTWQKAVITESYNQTPDFKTLILKPEVFIPFKAGNFVEVAISKSGSHKSYSVVSTPLVGENEGAIEVGVKLYPEGELSPKLFDLKPGDNLLMRGPTGIYFVWEQSDRNIVMIAGGSGICPMVSILRQYQPGEGQIHLLFSTKSGSVYYENELKELCRKKGVGYTLVQTGSESRVSKKLLIEKFGKLIDKNTDFFVAGPTEFVGSISYWLQEAGVNPANLKTDDFGK